MTTISSASLSQLANTPATSAVGPQANQTQMNQFLTLLTTQLKNQDPTQPTDPTQFVAQLAQFSSVEQLTKSNTSLASISAAIGGLALGQYTSLINHTVTAPVSTVTVPSSGAVSTPLSYNVTSANLANPFISITNSSGKVVAQMPINSSSGTVTFDGTDGKGNKLPAGQYNVALVGLPASGAPGATASAGTVGTSDTVTGVIQGTNGGWNLQLKGGQVVAATSITSTN
jgi:flagellar basal-body rod modification protein FlgD